MIVFCLADVGCEAGSFSGCFRKDPTFVDLGEIFCSDTGAEGHYVKKWEMPSAPSISRFDEYLEFLRGDERHFYWLDIKFHDLNRFNPPQFDLSDPPLIIQRIVDKRDAILLVDWANPLRGACFKIQSLEIKSSHVEKSEGKAGYREVTNTSLTISTIRSAIKRRGTFRVVENYLVNHKNVFRLDYEAILEGDDATAVRAALGNWIGVSILSESDSRYRINDWPSWFDLDLARSVLEGTSAHWWAT